MEEYNYTIRIPKDRIAVIIGKSGETKKEIEKLGKCSLYVDSNEGEVTITGNDTLSLFEIKDVVRAIGRGFNPEVAQVLVKQDNCLEVVNVLDYVSDRKKHLERVRGRVIGTDGKTREMLERISDCSLCVYGKTVSIIGTAERAALVRHAVESLLGGSPHSHAYHWLEKSIADLKKREKLE